MAGGRNDALVIIRVDPKRLVTDGACDADLTGGGAAGMALCVFGGMVSVCMVFIRGAAHTGGDLTIGCGTGT